MPRYEANGIVESRTCLTRGTSVFLSTENDFHHNLRVNISGHTNLHNSRIASELKNQKRKGVVSCETSVVWEGGKCCSKVTRKKIEKGKGERVQRQRKYYNNNKNNINNNNISSNNNNNKTENVVAILKA